MVSCCCLTGETNVCGLTSLSGCEGSFTTSIELLLFSPAQAVFRPESETAFLHLTGVGWVLLPQCDGWSNFSVLYMDSILLDISSVDLSWFSWRHFLFFGSAYELNHRIKAFAHRSQEVWNHWESRKWALRVQEKLLANSHLLCRWKYLLPYPAATYTMLTWIVSCYKRNSLTCYDYHKHGIKSMWHAATLNRVNQCERPR